MSRNLAYSLMLVLVALCAYLAGSWQAPRQSVSAAADPPGREVAYYHCPMHPSVKSDTPGSTPCCGMAFEPVYADAVAPAATPEKDAARGLRITGEQQQLMGVKVAAVEESPGTESLRLFGRVAADETRLRKVNVGVAGYVRDVSNVTTGGFVRKDQLLAILSSPDVRQPVSAYVVTLDVLDREHKTGGSTPQQIAAATASMDLAIDRLLSLGFSPAQLAEIRKTRFTTTHIELRSPIDGFLIRRNVSPGERVEAGTEVFQVGALDRIWILADLPAGQGADVKPGTAARVRVPGRTTPLSARVSRSVLPLFDPETQSFKIRLEAENRDFVLRPDMFVDVDFQVSYGSTVLVPADAVMVSGLRSRVFVERSIGVFEPREVETGSRRDGRVAIVKGLQPGEKIAISGTFLLDSETRMKSDDRPHH